jgi:hypothetical protein
MSRRNIGVAAIEKHHYSIEALEQELHSLERRYRLSSNRFYRAYVAGNPPEHVDPFDQVLWADTYSECQRLTGLASPATNGRRPARDRRKAFQPAH